MNELISEIFGVHAGAIRVGFSAGIFGAAISLLSRDEHPNVKTTLLIIITAGLIAPFCYVVSGVWIAEDMVRLTIATVAGFIGRPILRMLVNIANLLSNQPFKYLKELSGIIKGFWK